MSCEYACKTCGPTLDGSEVADGFHIHVPQEASLTSRDALLLAARKKVSAMSRSSQSKKPQAPTPLDLENQRSVQRVQATVAAWEKEVDKLRKVEQSDLHQLSKHRQELHMLSSSALDRDDHVRSARHLLSTPSLLSFGLSSSASDGALGASLETQREALRETALDSQRRERMMRLRSVTYRDEELARRRADDVDALKAEERKRVSAKQQQEAERVGQMRKKWEMQAAQEAAGADACVARSRPPLIKHFLAFPLIKHFHLYPIPITSG